VNGQAIESTAVDPVALQAHVDAQQVDAPVRAAK